MIKNRIKLRDRIECTRTKKTKHATKVVDQCAICSILTETVLIVDVIIRNRTKLRNRKE